MTLNEALKFAEECRKNENISTSAKALILLADEVKRLQKENEHGREMSRILNG